MLKHFLVEIRVKDWVHVPEGESRVFAWEEVDAVDAVAARYKGYDQFVVRTKYEPIMRRRFEKRGLSLDDYCAPDAVEI